MIRLLKSRNWAAIAICLGLTAMTHQSHGQAAILVYFFGDKVASEKFYLSLDGGLNIANMTNFGEGDVRLGINFGLGTHIKIGENWYLSPELKPLSRKGAKNLDIPFELDDELAIDDATSDLKLNYLDLPVPIQFKTNSGFYLATGPQFSLLTSAQQITEITLTDGTVVTYSWYRFVDQPALQQLKLGKDEKARLQSLVEQIHANWTVDKEYLPAPSRGSLVELDSALLVTPPKGMERGYVPIATNQRKP